MKNTDRNLWLLTFTFWFVGDVITTYYGLSIGLVESNQAALAIMELGWGYIIFGKLLSITLGYAHYWYIRTHYTLNYAPYIMPVVLVVLGVGATLWNSYLIITF